MRLALLATAALLVGLSGPVRADVLDLGTTTPLTIVDISGLTTLGFQHSPDTDTKEANNNTTLNNGTTTSLFPNQNTSTVLAGVETMFNVTGLVSVGATNLNGGPGTINPGASFNFAAVHQDSGEIVFDWATPQTSITFDASTPQLSNIQFFSSAVSSVPEPSTWALMLLGFVGLGYAFRQRRRSVGYA
jgi:hypothetical protein